MDAIKNIGGEQMNTLNFEIQPTTAGDEISLKWFLYGKLLPPSAIEKKWRLTVPLTDAISAVLKISAAIDPMRRVSIKRHSGFFFPEFSLYIISEKFEIEAEKVFLGRANRNNVFNSRVLLTIRSSSDAMIKLVENSYKELGPKPLLENYQCSPTMRLMQIYRPAGTIGMSITCHPKYGFVKPLGI
jgi:hypothetical protein